MAWTQIRGATRRRGDDPAEEGFGAAESGAAEGAVAGALVEQWTAPLRSVRQEKPG
jgi:hypothetical protein